MWHQPGLRFHLKHCGIYSFGMYVVLELAATLLNIIQLSILVAAQCNNGHSSMRERITLCYICCNFFSNFESVLQLLHVPYSSCRV